MANRLPRAVTPDERDHKAADYLVRGDNAVDALRKAGFPPAVCKHSTYQFQRSKSLRIALMQRLKHMQFEIPSPEQRADLVRMQLLSNLVTNSGAKGSNMAAKLLGMDKQVDMFVTQQQQSGVFVIMAPEPKRIADLEHGIKTIEASEVPQALPPGKDDFPDYE